MKQNKTLKRTSKSVITVGLYHDDLHPEFIFLISLVLKSNLMLKRRKTSLTNLSFWSKKKRDLWGVILVGRKSVRSVLQPHQFMPQLHQPNMSAPTQTVFWLHVSQWVGIKTRFPSEHMCSCTQLCAADVYIFKSAEEITVQGSKFPPEQQRIKTWF